MQFNGIEITIDANGYLKNPNQWSKALALKIAQIEKIEMTEAHWQVIDFIRAFYLEFNTSPAMRMLVKAITQKYGEEFGKSRYLLRLFPEGPAKQATKIAGLPKPVRCL